MLETLKLLGIKEKPAEVYSTALALGTSSVKEIAQKSGLKRPTVYVYLEELVKDGFMQKIPLGKKEYYQAVSPKILERMLENNLSELKKSMSNLEMIYAEGKGKPRVSSFEGEKGLNQIYEELKEARELIFWSDLSSVENLFPEAVRKINQATVDNRIFTREIMANTPEAKNSSKRWKATAGDLYSSRIATGPIYNDSVVYGNVVAFFRLERSNLFVVRIEDPTIAVTMTTLFDMAWRSGKPFM